VNSYPWVVNGGPLDRLGAWALSGLIVAALAAALFYLCWDRDRCAWLRRIRRVMWTPTPSDHDDDMRHW
jgi:hypothetical protein